MICTLQWQGHHGQRHRTSGERCLGCDRHGTSALEFALLAPILLLMLTAIAQFGSIYMLHNNMQNVAREVSLRLATGDLTLAGSASWARERLPRRVDRYAIQAVRNDDFFDVAISAPLDQAVPIDPLGFFSTGMLTVRAIAREVEL